MSDEEKRDGWRSRPWVRLMGLWETPSPQGLILKGKIGTAEVLVFRNSRKNKPNDPDFLVYLQEQETWTGAKR